MNAQQVRGFAAAFAEATRDATDAGVPSVLIDRAVALAIEQEAGLPFLTALTALCRDESAVEPVESIVPFLRTDEERTAASRVANETVTQQGDELALLRFLVEQHSPCDDEVRALVLDGMRQALAPAGEKSAKQKTFNERDARSALLGLKRIFDVHGKRFFLDRGTLLGAVREGGFIATDYDIDLGIFADEVTLEQVKEMFEPTPFEINQDFDYKVGLRSPSGIQIDFFLTTRERGYFLSKGFRSIHNWYFSPFELSEFEFLGTTFLIPDRYEKHLDENYGNWRNSAIFYDLSYNEPCVTYGQSPYSVDYLSRRMATALRDGDRYFSESPARALQEQFGIDYMDWFARGGNASAVPTITSPTPSRPIVVVDRFSTYTHRLRRLIESALSLTDNVTLCVLDSPDGNDPTAPLADRLALAGAIDRIHSVRTLAEVTAAAIDEMIGQGAVAIVFATSDTGDLDLELVQRARERGCTLAIFGDESIAVTLDDSTPVTIRPAPTRHSAGSQ